MELVGVLAAQLGGTARVGPNPGGGTLVEVAFPLPPANRGEAPAGTLGGPDH